MSSRRGSFTCHQCNLNEPESVKRKFDYCEHIGVCRDCYDHNASTGHALSIFCRTCDKVVSPLPKEETTSSSSSCGMCCLSLGLLLAFAVLAAFGLFICSYTAVAARDFKDIHTDLSRLSQRITDAVKYSDVDFKVLVSRVKDLEAFRKRLQVLQE